MATGTVNEFGRSQKGSTKVKIDSKWYFVGKCNIDGMNVGDRIEFESNVFGDNGNLHGLQTWKPVRHERPAPANGSAPPPGNGYVDEATMRFISNVVGSAITAGTIKQPAEIRAWYQAAKAAAMIKADPQLDDDIPDNY